MAVRTNFPQSRTIRLKGARKSNDFGKGGASGIGSLIGLLTQNRPQQGSNIFDRTNALGSVFEKLNRDSNNRDFLLSQGLTREAVDSMSSAMLEATVSSSIEKDLAAQAERGEEKLKGADLRNLLPQLLGGKEATFQGFDPVADLANRELLEGGRDDPSLLNLPLIKAKSERREEFGEEQLTREEGTLSNLAGAEGTDASVGRALGSPIFQNLIKSAQQRDRDVVTERVAGEREERDITSAALLNRQKIEAANVKTIREVEKENRERKGRKGFPPKQVTQIDPDTGKPFRMNLRFDNKGNIIGATRIAGEAGSTTSRIEISGPTKGTKTTIQKDLLNLKSQQNDITRLKETVFDEEGGAQGLFSTLGNIEMSALNRLDRIGFFNPKTTVGSAIKGVSSLLGATDLTEGMKSTLIAYRKATIQIGRIFTKFRKEITGVAGPPEEFERLEEISLSISKLGIVGLRASIEVMEQINQDRIDLLSDTLLAKDDEAFLAALNQRMESRVDGLKIRFGGTAIGDAIEEADSRALEKISSRESKRGSGLKSLIGGL